MDESLNFSSLFARGALSSITLGLEKPLRLQTCLETQLQVAHPQNALLMRAGDAGLPGFATDLFPRGQGDMCLEQDPEPPLRGLGGFTESSPPTPRAALPRCV